MSQDIGGYDDWLAFISISYHIFKLLFKMILIGSKTAKKIQMPFER